MQDRKIESLARAYFATGKGKERIFAAIAEQLYREPQLYGFEDEDAAAEALLRHRERILRLVERYVPRGSSFEAYLATSLRFIARSMRRVRKREAERELVCEKAESLSLEGRDQASADESESLLDFPGSESDHSLCVRRRAFAKRLLYLFLKCSWSATETETRNVARAAGLSEDWLAAALGQSRRFLEAERNRYERLALRRDRAWVRVHLLENRLAEELEEARRESLGAALTRAREAHRSALTELRAFKPLVPNAIVARILGVPKGTVDSGLFYLKHTSSSPKWAGRSADRGGKKKGEKASPRGQA